MPPSINNQSNSQTSSRSSHHREIRKFGLVMFLAFGLLGVLSWYRHHPLAAEVMVILAGVLLVGSLSVPRLMRPVYDGWMMFAHGLGWVNTRMILVVIFYVVFTPVGLVMRLFGKDPLGLRFEPAQRGGNDQPKESSYWIKRNPEQLEASRGTERYRQQF